MITNIKDTPYFALYGEIYRLHGKYLEPVADDSFWSALMQDVDTLCKKYKDTESNLIWDDETGEFIPKE